MNGAGWTAQEILSVLARERFEVAVVCLCLGTVSGIVSLLLWTHRSYIVRRILWRD